VLARPFLDCPGEPSILMRDSAYFRTEIACLFDNGLSGEMKTGRIDT